MSAERRKILLNTCKHMAQEDPGQVYPVTHIRQTLANGVRATSSTPEQGGKRQRTERGCCQKAWLLFGLSVCTPNPVPDCQSPCT